METMRFGAARCRPCEAARCQANGRSIGQRGAVYRAPRRDIVVEGSTVWKPYGVEQHDAGRARRHDARRMGAASGNVVPCTEHRFGTSWWRAAPYGATSTRRPTIRCGATRCRPHNVEQHDAKRRGAASGKPYGVEQHDAGRARRHDARRMGAASGNVAPCTGRRIGTSWWRAAPYGNHTVWSSTMPSEGALHRASHTVWSNTMPAVRGGTMPGEWAQHRATWRRARGAASGYRGGGQHRMGRRQHVGQPYGVEQHDADRTTWSSTMPSEGALHRAT